jgi:hypothetical protein
VEAGVAMLIRPTFSLLLGFFLIACGRKSNEETHASLKDSIQGVWWSDTTNFSADFLIEGDTLMFVDQFVSTPFRLNGNRISYVYDGDTLTYDLEMRRPDTLVYLRGSYIDSPQVLFHWNNTDEDSIRSSV